MKLASSRRKGAKQSSWTVFTWIALTLTDAAAIGGDPGPIINDALLHRQGQAVGEFDWVEIYNPRAEALSLGGWSLFVDREEFLRVQPGVVLPPQAHLLVTFDPFQVEWSTGTRLSLLDSGRREIDSAWVYLRGDVDENDRMSIADPVAILRFAFGAGPVPLCPGVADMNDDGRVALDDAVLLLMYLFRAGDSPAAPYPNYAACH